MRFWLYFEYTYMYFYITFNLNKTDWRDRGIQDLPGHQRRQDNQACGVLVYWNLCYHVRFRGLFAVLKSLGMLPVYSMYKL